MKRLLILVIVFPFLSFGQTTLLVPSQYSTIQAAINASLNSDTVLVSPGTYYENINFNGKNIVVASHYLLTNDTSYITSTIIDGNQNGTVVTFDNGEDTTAVLSGFTIQNGYKMGSAPNIFAYGGGIQILNSSPLIINCKITNNHVEGYSSYGGGIYINGGGAHPSIIGCEITNNYAFSWGGGLFIESGATLLIENCTVAYNSFGQNGGGGIYSYDSGLISMKNTIIWYNSDSIGNVCGNCNLYIDGNSSILVSYSNIQGGFAGTGNIDQDPLFVDPINGDYHLQASSPCIDTGDPSSIYNDPDGSRNDMGAYPYDACAGLTTSSTTNIIVCDSLVWNDSTYTQSGIYSYSGSSTPSNNYSMSFDGVGDYVDFSNPSTFDFLLNSSYSVSFSFISNSSSSTIISFGDMEGNYQNRGLFIYLNNNILTAKIRGDLSDPFDTDVTFSINQNQYYDVVLVRDYGNSLSLLVDGNLVDTKIDITGLASPFTSNRSLLLGIKQTYPGPGYIGDFTGNIDEVSIWNIALDSTQINTYMNCPPTGNELGLVGYWNFEEGSGNTVFDQTANGNDGVINGVTYDTNVPPQSCGLTNANGCDSTAVLNLTINQADTSYTNITACDSVVWNGTTYDSSGTYSYSGTSPSNNYSMSFDGIDDYVQIQNLFNSTEFSVGFWIKADPQQSQVFRIDFDNGSKYFLLDIQQDGSFYTSYSGGSEVNNFTIADNAWHYITITYTNGVLLHYIDGSITLNTNIGLWSNLSNSPATISIGVGTNSYMSGSIDNFSLWDIALSQTDIQNYMNCPPTGNESGLVGYWNFETGSGTTAYDQTSNGNDGTINGPTWATNVPAQSCNLTNTNGCDSVAILNLTINQGDTSYTNITTCDSAVWNGTTYDSSGTYSTTVGSNNNYSMSFDGVDDYVDLGVNSNFLFQNLFSFEAWVKVPLSPGPTGNGAIIGALSGYRFDIYAGNANNGAFYVEFPDLNPWTVITVMGSTDLRDGNWHHLAVTYDGSQVVLYVDGLVEDSSNKTGNISPPTNAQYPFLIGSANHVGYEDFNGEISNVELWNIALNQQEIQQYMNCPPTGSESGLIGYWNFEEGTGTTVYDQTSNGNNGTINGATYDSNVPSQFCGLTNSNGCDSTAILNLTINQSDTSYSNITACDSLLWNGTTYTQSGTYSYSGSSISNNYAMSFDGVDDYVDCGNSSSLSLGNDNITLACWVNTNSPAVSQSLIMKGTTYAGGLSYSLGIQGADGGAFLNGGVYAGIDDNSNEVQMAYYNPLSMSVWTHLAFVFDRTNNISFLYVNGQLVDTDSTTISGNISTSSSLILGGHSQSLGNSVLNGIMDDACVWNRTLTQQEIQQYMNCPPTGSESGLVGYWNFEQGSGTTAYDQTSNGNDGALVNGPTWDSNVPAQSCNFGLTNANGCDSTAILNLTINNSTSAFTSVTECDSYTWVVNGITYSSSGLYTDTSTNANGCLHTDSLNLTINYTTSSTTIDTACDAYTWNGQIYTNSGTYDTTFAGTFVNANTANSIVFDGNNDWINVPNDPSFDLSGKSFTIEMYYKTPGTTNSSTVAIITDYISGAWKYFYLFLNPDNTITFAINEGGSNSCSLNSSISIGDNQWHHIAITRDVAIDSMSLYIDGILMESEFCDRNGDISSGQGLAIGGNHQSRFTECSMSMVSFSETVRYTSNFTPPCDFILDNNSLLYFDFSEGSGTSVTDLSGNGNTGTLINGPVWDAGVTCSSNTCDSTAVLNLTINQSDTSYSNITACDSAVWNGTTYTQSGTYSYGGSSSSASNNYSLDYDGNDDYVEAPSISNYDTIRHYLTLSSWIRLDNSWSNGGTVVARRNFVGNPTGERHHFELTIQSDRSILFSTANNQNNNLYTAQLQTTSNIIGLNSWHYVSCTFLNGVVTIYMDGNVVISQNFGYKEMFPNNHWVNFGRIHRSGGVPFFYEFNGEISDVEIWATVLSQSEIQNYMNCPPTGTESGLVGYWNFEEGTGTTVYDQTSNGNNGTINGATYNTNVPAQSCNFGLTNANGCDSTAILNLTINNSTSAFTSVTECDSYTWVVNGITYSSSGLYTDTSTNANGCSHTDSLNLTINYTTSSTTIDTVCDSYTWNGQVYTTSVIDSAVFTNTNGCDSTAILNLTINQADTSYSNITACDSAVWNGTTYTQSGTYSYGGSSSSASNNYSLDYDGNDDQISIPHSSDFNLPSISVLLYANPNAFGPQENYIIDKSHDNWGSRNWSIRLGGGGELQVEVRINNTYHIISSSQVIHLNQWNKLALTYDGQFLRLIHDNIEIINENLIGQLTNSNYPISIGVFPPSAQDYYFNGQIDDVHIWDYALSPQEIQNYMNCPPTGTESGLVGYWNFEEGTGTTVYDQTSNGNNGTLVNGPTWDTNVPAQSCNFGLTNANGCDSTAILNLTINNSTSAFTSVTECDSYTWAVNGMTYSSSGLYIDTSNNANGCLHTDSLNLTINYTTSSTTIDTACDSYTWNGQVYTTSVIDSAVFTNIVGCDSTATLNLTINPSTTSTSTVTECDTYTWNGTAYTASGTYTYSTQNADGCDSTATLNLTINQGDTSYTNITACDSVVWNGVTYDSSGTYSYSGSSNNYSMSFDGANDNVYLNTTLSSLGINNSSFTISVDVNASQFGSNDDIFIGTLMNNSNSNNGFKIVFESTGIIKAWIGGSGSNDLYHVSSGYESINQWYNVVIVVDRTNDDYFLYVNGIYEGWKDISNLSPIGIGDIIKLNYDDAFNGLLDNVHIWNMALSQQEIQNYMSCPPTGNEAGLVGYWNFEEGSGTTALDLTPNGNNGTINGATYDSNVPVQSCVVGLTNSNGCDSTATLNLTINPSTTSTSTVTECDTYTWNGTAYTASGTYTYSTQNADGCDSTATLNLTVNPSTTSTSNVIECDTYSWNGMAYTSSGVYTYVTTNSNGCDSTAMLNLTINPSTTSSVSVTECDSYTWAVNGMTYSSSGLYIDTSNNANGCLHTDSLNLTINYTTSSTTIDTACDSYTWNDSTYTQSGTYSYSSSTVSNNYSMSFDGSRYVNVGNDTSFNIDNSPNMQKTIMFWAQYSPDNLNYGTVMVNAPPSCSGQSSCYDLFVFFQDQGNPGIIISTGSSVDPCAHELIPLNINYSNWHHYTITLEATGPNSGVKTLWLDGINIYSCNYISNAPDSLNSDLIFGAHVLNGNTMTGVDYLDDVSFWNRVLSQQEIQQYSTCPPIGTESGLLGYWNFDEGSGNIVYDQTSNGNNGNINNNANYTTNVPWSSQLCQLTITLTLETPEGTFIV